MPRCRCENTPELWMDEVLTHTRTNHRVPYESDVARFMGTHVALSGFYFLRQGLGAIAELSEIYPTLPLKCS